MKSKVNVKFSVLNKKNKAKATRARWKMEYERKYDGQRKGRIKGKENIPHWAMSMVIPSAPVGFAGEEQMNVPSILSA